MVYHCHLRQRKFQDTMSFFFEKNPNKTYFKTDCKEDSTIDSKTDKHHQVSLLMN